MTPLSGLRVILLGGIEKDCPSLLKISNTAKSPEFVTSLPSLS
jgi:hypothetical protein